MKHEAFIRAYVDGSIAPGTFDKMEAIGRYANAVSYIGPESWTKRLKVAAKIARCAYGIDLNLAGWAHDRLYFIGGGEADREKADTAFLVIMNHLIDTDSSKVWGIGRLQRNLARTRALNLYALVRENGEHFFTFRLKPTETH